MFLLSLKEFRTYTADFVGRLLYFPVEFGFFYLLFSVVYSGQTFIAGFSFNMIILYSFTSVILMDVLPFRMALEVEDDVVDGDLIYWLSKPVDYQPFVFSYHFAKFLFKLSLGLLTYVIAASLFLADFSMFRLGLFTASALLSFVFVCLFCYIIGLLAFWVGRNYWLRNLLSVAILILGGGLIPLSWFPKGVDTILQILPFQFTVYLPASIASGATVYSLATTFFVMAVWIATLFILSIWLWKRGKDKFESAGG